MASYRGNNTPLGDGLGQRRLARRPLALLLALCALLALAAPATAAASASGDAPGLSAEDQARFVEGAKAVGGLTDDQVQQALKDPEFRNGVPVELVVTGGAGAAEAGPSLGGTPVTASTGCRDVWAYVDMLNITRSRLWRFQVSKYFCWNGTRVTRADAPVVSPTITTLGTVTGWDYVGINAEFDRYYQLGKSAYGGHHSYRQGRFKYCPPRVVCLQNKYPYVNLWGHYNGTWDWSAGV